MPQKHTPVSLLFDLFGEWQEAEILSLLEGNNGFDRVEDKPALAEEVHRMIQKFQIGERGYRETGPHAGRWVTFSSLYTLCQLHGSYGTKFNIPKKGTAEKIDYPVSDNLLVTIDWTEDKTDDGKQRLYLVLQSRLQNPPANP